MKINMSKTKTSTRLPISLSSTTPDRAVIRAKIFRHWIRETPGTLTITNTYRYDVETLSNGDVIYLTRPTRLNKGADFIIFCERFTKWKKGTDRPPKHRDLFEELIKVTAKSDAHKTELLTALHRIWACEESSVVLDHLVLLKGDVAVERALLLAKWFFIEQDVTYWTESGRHMLRAGLEQDGALGVWPELTTEAPTKPTESD